MAVSTKSYFNNSIVGVPQVGGDFDIFEISSNPKHAIGMKFEREDGAIFRYSHFALAIPQAGRPVGPDLNGSALAITANAVFATSSVFQQGVEKAGLYPGMKGSRFVAICQTASHQATIGAWDGGYFAVLSGAGCGNCYRVKHTFAASGTSTIIQLYEKLQSELNTTSDVAIVPCKYANLVTSTATLSGATQNTWAIGVNCAATTADYFGWVQTKGITTVSYDQAGATGAAWLATISTGTGGWFAPYMLVGSDENVKAASSQFYPSAKLLYHASAASTNAVGEIFFE